MNQGTFEKRFMELLATLATPKCHGLTFERIYGSRSGLETRRSQIFTSWNAAVSQEGMTSFIESWLPAICGYRLVSIKSIEIERASRQLPDSCCVYIVQFVAE